MSQPQLHKLGLTAYETNTPKKSSTFRILEYRMKNDPLIYTTAKSYRISPETIYKNVTIEKNIRDYKTQQ